MNLVLAEGIVSGEQAVIMDLSVLNEAPVAANKNDVMARFDMAHEVIHRVFVGVTEKLLHVMDPIEEVA